MSSFRLPPGRGRVRAARGVTGLALLAMLLASAGLSLGASPTAASRATPAPAPAACPRIVVPAYFKQATAASDWLETIAAAPQVEFIILNPNSGVGEAIDPGLKTYVELAQAAGIKVLGYVYTNLAKRDVEDVIDEVHTYEAWYEVDGIHIDGAQDDPEYLPYYRQLAAAIRAAGPGDTNGIVWLNPGFVPHEDFMEIVDIVETYEWFYDRYPATEFPDWIYDYPAARFAHVVYHTPSDEATLQSVLDLARQRNAGYIYITDRDISELYQTLPSYWESKLDRLC